MNLSGHAVRDFLGFFGVDTKEPLAQTLLVVYDDLDLPEGKLRYRARGSAGGHRGLKSVIDGLGHRDFSRLKIGVGRQDGVDSADYVLEKVGAATREILQRAAQDAARSLNVWLDDGLEAAMNRFNRSEDGTED
jgi:PTH1 family peptidyl-tRNA hydrolase